MIEILPILPVPKFGEPCNGCGMCCQQMPCSLAAELLNCTEGPCVALEMHDGRTKCGLVVRPEHYLTHISGLNASPEVISSVAETAGKLFADMLGVGKGCCSGDSRVRKWANKIFKESKRKLQQKRI